MIDIVAAAGQRGAGGGQARAEGKAEPMAALCKDVALRLEQGKRIRRKVFDSGRIYLDRLLPFLVLYRRPAARPDPGTADFVTASAAYLVATDERGARKEVRALVDAVRALSMTHFGAFLLVEVWSRPSEHPPIVKEPHGPGFRLFGAPEGAACDRVIDVLAQKLRKVKSTGQFAVVDVPEKPHGFALRPRPLLPRKEPGVLQIGVEVEPSYRDPGGATLFPGVLRTLRAGADRALRHAAFQFARRETTHRPRDFHSLGRRAMVKAVWDVDARLDRISSSFDFLLAVTPTNLGELWNGFRKSDYERLPPMRYRPLPIDPSRTKRDLFSIPMERVEDPTMFELLSDKQEQLDRQMTMLRDRGTERFLLGGLQLYGRITTALVRSAEAILERVPATMRAPGGGGTVSVPDLVRLAEQEIAHYRSLWDGVEAGVHTRRSVLAGLMVSNGQLLVASDAKIPRGRLDALLQHEVGTHLVTYYNGKAQRLAQLRSGFAGYEELQEGLAVLAEYLVSGMTPNRLRTLAARVLGARALVDGASFVDTFRLLCRYGFQRRAAFQICLRLYRGGGLIKDCIYLRGLNGVLEYLARGEPLDPLFVGKISIGDLQVITELRSRGVIEPPRLMPRYLDRPECQRRLAGLRNGKQARDLLQADPALD